MSVGLLLRAHPIPLQVDLPSRRLHRKAVLAAIQLQHVCAASLRCANICLILPDAAGGDNKIYLPLYLGGWVCHDRSRCTYAGTAMYVVISD